MMSRRVRRLLACLALSVAAAAAAEDRLVTDARYADGEPIPYILTFKNLKPTYAVVLLPGGQGLLNPFMEEGTLKFSFGGNFLIRSRELFADDDMVAVSTNATPRRERMRPIVEDLRKRFGDIRIYIIGTSRGTTASMTLGQLMDGEVAGFIHTSSMSTIAYYDTRQRKSRHLIVGHRNDECVETHFHAAQLAHDKFGTDLIAIEGGNAWGKPCDAYAHHGYNGVEKETVDKIKAWIRQDALEKPRTAGDKADVAPGDANAPLLPARSPPPDTARSSSAAPEPGSAPDGTPTTPRRPRK
jgi:hypothetical protein